MTEEKRLKYLRIALRFFGLFFIFGVFQMVKWIWPSAWTWEPRQPEYENKIMGIYATLGVFLLIAAKNPLAHLSLIRFTIWSSIIHGSIMLVQALIDVNDRDNLFGDVVATFIVAIVLGAFMPKKVDTEKSS
jgi:hypothetical protein